VESGKWKNGRWKMEDGMAGKANRECSCFVAIHSRFLFKLHLRPPRIKRATLPGKNIRYARAEKTQQQRNH
jgi:hypothetical protein